MLWLARGNYLPSPAVSKDDTVGELARLEKSLEIIQEISDCLPSDPAELRVLQLIGMIEWVLFPCQEVQLGLVRDRMFAICWDQKLSLVARSELVQDLRSELEGFLKAKKVLLAEADLERSRVVAEQEKAKGDPFRGLRSLLPVITLGAGLGKGKAKATTYETHEVYKAIDDKDIMKLMAIRDSQFTLLLTKSPGVGSVFPIIYAMRCGPRWEDVTILLVGALSRWVNHLDDSEELTAEQKNVLKVLRINLKAAIDFGLQSHQYNLISSYLQVLVMSEGERFLSKAISDISLALKAGPPEKPVQLAGEMVRKFATKDLRGVDGLSAVEDYVANATVDLLILSLYSVLSPTSDLLPTYAFARDTRMLGLFNDAYDQIPNLKSKSPRLRRTAEDIQEIWGNSKEGFGARVKALREVIDG